MSEPRSPFDHSGTAADSTQLGSSTFYPASAGIRPDLDDAHARVWHHVTIDGTWWTAAERRAAAAVVATAFADRDPLPPWASVSGDEGRRQAIVDLLDDGGAHAFPLADDVVDALYRMTAHAHTLTLGWYQNALATGMHDQAYVELCGVVVAVSAVCSFARTMGLPLPPIPRPHPSSAGGSTDADKVLPSASSPRNWVPVAPPGGRQASVVEALSVAPAAFELLWDHLAPAQYMSDADMADLAWTRPADGRRSESLSRPQAELIAGRVALLRQCFF